MQEDELIFLGAAVLLAPALPKKSPDPENDVEIQAALANAHFLYEEVKRRREKIRDGKILGYVELMKKLADASSRP